MVSWLVGCVVVVGLVNGVIVVGVVVGIVGIVVVVVVGIVVGIVVGVVIGVVVGVVVVGSWRGTSSSEFDGIGNGWAILDGCSCSGDFIVGSMLKSFLC